MMPKKFVTRIRTNEGDAQIDYNALANLPCKVKLREADINETFTITPDGNPLNDGYIYYSEGKFLGLVAGNTYKVCLKVTLREDVIYNREYDVKATSYIGYANINIQPDDIEIDQLSIDDNIVYGLENGLLDRLPIPEWEMMADVEFDKVEITVTGKGKPPIITQLPEYYIPDTIARTADVEAIKDIANNAVPAFSNKASGSLLALPDSAEQPFKSMKVFGKTEQFTTTGKNLLDVSSLHGKTITMSGGTITCNEDGGFTISGTPTGGCSMIMTSPFFPNGVYTMSLHGNFTNFQFTIVLKDADNTTITSLVAHTTKPILTFDTSDYPECTSIYYEFKRGGNNIAMSGTAYCQVELGTVTNPVYEPYTGGMPSPNPGYPQELKSVGNDGSVEPFVCGKNFINEKAIAPISVNAEGVKRYGWNLGTLPKGNYTLTVYGNYNVAESISYKIITDGVYSDYMSLTDVIKSKTIVLNGSQELIVYLFQGVTTLSDNVTLQLEVGVSPTPYEPYKTHQSLTLATPNGLCGIPVSSGGNYTDENGQQWICDEVDFERGVRVQRVGETAVTFKSTNVLSSGNRYGICVLTDKIAKSAFGGVSEKAVFRKATSSTTPNEFYENSTNFVFVGTTDDTDETIRAKFEGSKLFYVLAEPIETPLTEEEIETYKALHTNYPNTTIYNNDGAGTEVEYVADTKNYIDNKIATEVAKLTAAIITE